MDVTNNVILDVQNLTVKIQNRVILNDLSFQVQHGKIIAIVGPNGSGKSTLFKSLLKLIPYTGRISWSGKVKIGYVPQNIAIGDLPITVREFLSFKKDVNLEKYLKSVELDSHNISNKPLAVLSGGELQRVFIAWAIMDEPNVLLFDEPTSGVDIGSEDVVFGMLHKLSQDKGITILFISHDLHVVERYADLVLALNKKLLYYGDSKELETDELTRIIFGDSAIIFRLKEGKRA